MTYVGSAALAASFVLVASLPVWAQTRDGTYKATIRCAALPSTDIGPFSQEMSVTISGATLTGERAVGVRGQVGQSGVAEKWTGTVKPDGSISATSVSASSRAPINGSFSGRVADGSLQLRGAQTFTAPRGGSTSSRDCTVSAKR